MPDKRTHRGPHPEDRDAFGPKAEPLLRKAACDFCWLLDRGYAHRSSIKLVGDRYALRERQRTAVQRCACDSSERTSREARRIDPEGIIDQPLLIDGYNLLTTVEAALAGAVILQGRDGSYRDMASIHGHFKFVVETCPALMIIGEAIARLRPGECIWYLDSPVSNSGRLAALLRETAVAHSWNWRVELVPNPDPVLCSLPGIVATADSMILDRCARWVNLAGEVIKTHVSEAWVVTLMGDDEQGCFA
jgi:hypothetical protein